MSHYFQILAIYGENVENSQCWTIFQILAIYGENVKGNCKQAVLDHSTIRGKKYDYRMNFAMQFVTSV